MKIVLALIAFGFLGFEAASESKLLTLLDEKMNRDMETASQVEEAMRNGSRSGCSSLNSPDMSSCFKTQVQSMEITSSVHLAILIKAGINASLYDQKKGYNKETVKVFLADNMLTSLERVDLSNFHASKISPNTPEEESLLEALRKSEEEALKTLLSESLPMIESSFTEIKTRDPASSASPIDVWRSKKISQIKSRFSRFDKKDFKFSKK